MSYARERGMEREAVTDERTLMRDALKHTMGEARLPEVRAEFERRAQSHNLIEVERRPGLPGRAFTTGEMQSYERELIERMKLGQGTREVLADGNVREQVMREHAHLSASQRQAVEDILTGRDRMMALEGVAGGGKTTSLAAVREGAERAGYQVEGLAPTSRAAQKLAEAGIETQTLQRHLARGEQQDDGHRRLYVIDESSMASTKQIHTFVERLRENDRVLFVGDVRQHEAVEAGRPYAQLQEAGMRTARLDEIIRQKDPALKEAVEQLARGEVREAIGNLNGQGRVHEIGDRQERISEIAREYVRSPERTLVVSPDNASRREINEAIHRTMQNEGKVSNNEQRVHVLYARQDVTGADRQHAQNYERGDVLRYSKGSKPLGIEPGEYARVSHVDRESNTLTVKRHGGEELSYDPRRLQGVTVYRDSERTFAQGDRVQLTAPYHEQKLANRELATIERIDGRRQSETSHGLRARGRVQREAASASRLRLCGDEPQQPGPDRRPGADPCGLGASARRTAQQPHGLRVSVACAVRCEVVYQRCEDVGMGTESGFHQGDGTLTAGDRRKNQTSIYRRGTIARAEHWIRRRFRVVSAARI